MITIPVEAASYLPYVMKAAEREGYLGLMLVLARTAEARSLHEELTRDWTSIHDVTGHALAVLCPEPEREELRSRVSSLTAVRRAGEEPPRRMRGLAELAAVRKQTAGLQQHLDMAAHVDPDLGRELADGLSAHIESDAPADEARAWLSGLAARVIAHPRRAELLGLDTKLHKVARSLEEGACPGGRRVWEARAEEERRLEQDRVRLAEAEGGGGLHNTLSGTTVHGSSVQAGNIDALHFHVHGDGDAASRRPGRGVAAWLRGRLWHGGG